MNKNIEKLLASPLVAYAIGGVLLWMVFRRFGLIAEPKTAAEKILDKAAKEIKDSNAIWSTDFWQQYPAKAYTDSQAENLAKHIEDSFGFINDDEARIYGVFRQLKYQTNVSQVSHAYTKLFRRDLHSDLRDALNDSEMKEIYSIIANKPL